MNWVVYRVKVCYWLMKLGWFKPVSAWKYSKKFKVGFSSDGSPKDDVLKDFTR